MWKIVLCVLFCHLFLLVKSNSVDADLTVTKPVTCGQNLTQPQSGFHLAIVNLTKGECMWLLKPNETTSKTPPKISLFIRYLYLHENDSLTIFKSFDDAINGTNPIMNPITAQNGSITIVTSEKQLVLKLVGSDKYFQRKFEGMYQSQACIFDIPPDVQIMHSPIAPEGITDIDCKYNYKNDPHVRAITAFTFDQFNFTSSKVELSHSTLDGLYNHDSPYDFFPFDNHTAIGIQVNMKLPTPEYYILRVHEVDSTCSFSKTLKDQELVFNFGSPPQVLNNGTIVNECRWIFQHSDATKILGLKFDKLHFDSALDIISINDGPSELSPPLLQVTASSGNISTSPLIRSTGPSMWIAFKPLTYASTISLNITTHGQGGYHKGSDEISMKSTDGNDTVFLLEVEQGKAVYLTFNTSDFAPPATLSIYDGFDQTDLLASLHGNVWYPVLSKSSKMMIIATSFNTGSFKAHFEGVSPDCLKMGTLSDENYVLTGNCNRSCVWVIPPQDLSGSVLLLNLQFLSLNKGDQIEIFKLDSAKTQLGMVTTNDTYVPRLSIPASMGALVEVHRGVCEKKDDIVLVGHSSYVPECGKDLTLNPLLEFQINSPLYPDTYPIFASCQWKLNTAKENLVHLSFHSLKLAPNHCVKITPASDNKTQEYDGNNLPADLFISGNSVVEFNSGNCKSAKVDVSLKSSEGFVINGTVADCGTVMSGKTSGTFTVPANKSLCIWKVSVPPTGNDANDIVNTIQYTISKKDDPKNYVLHVYDGDSIREPAIVNDTAEIWSRTNNLIFIYKRIDISKPSTLLTVTYSTIGCNDSMQCDNKMCLHPDWRCDGNNDCGDFSDERNCASVPIPPEIKLEGYSSTTFWVTIFIMLGLGAGLGLGVPFFYQKYKNGQYRRFGEISVID